MAKKAKRRPLTIEEKRAYARLCTVLDNYIDERHDMDPVNFNEVSSGREAANIVFNILGSYVPSTRAEVTERIVSHIEDVIQKGKDSSNYVEVRYLLGAIESLTHDIKDRVFKEREDRKKKAREGVEILSC